MTSVWQTWTLTYISVSDIHRERGLGSGAKDVIKRSRVWWRISRAKRSPRHVFVVVPERGRKARRECQVQVQGQRVRHLLPGAAAHAATLLPSTKNWN